MSKLQILKDTAASGPGQTGSGSKSATSATSLLSSASASPRTKRKYKETLNFVSFHSKVNMRRKWRSKKSAFYKFVDLESDFDSSELNAYTVRGDFFSFFHSLLSSASVSPRTKRKYKETLNFVSFHSKVNMRRKWRSKKSAFYKFVDLESDFDSSELNAYTVGGQIFFLFFFLFFS